MVVVGGGQIVADTREALALREASYPPVLHIPREDPAGIGAGSAAPNSRMISSTCAELITRAVSGTGSAHFGAGRSARPAQS